jgi:transposase
MMGEQARTESLFYYFRLEEQIPEDQLLRLLDRYIDFSFVRERLKTFYSSTGRPSIDPEVLLRLLLVGYLYGITSERRLLDEVRMHLAYRWFTRLDLNAEIPDHSTFSKNRHGRFRQSGVFREVFEEIVRRCVEAGLVKGETLAVDGTMVAADASQHSRIRREELRDAAQVSRTVQQYLAELEQANPVAQPALVSTTDPDALFSNQGWRISPDGLLRQLSHRHRQSGDSGSGSHARAVSSGDSGRAKDDGEKREAGSSSQESGSRQSLWQRRVPGMVDGPWRGTAYSGH